MQATTLAIDLAKDVFAVCGANAAGMVIWHRELRHAELLRFMRKMGPARSGWKACGGAHYWARQLIALWHQVRLISPALVTRYRKGNKTGRNDAEAVLEAVTRPFIRIVAIKSLAPQDLLALSSCTSKPK